MAPDSDPTNETTIRSNEQQFLLSLQSDDFDLTLIRQRLRSLRADYLSLLLSDLDAFGRNPPLRHESRLWDIHLKVNARFRKALTRAPESRDKSRHFNESGSLESHYARFIKDSRRYYRAYLSHVCEKYDDVPELGLIASDPEFQLDDSHARMLKAVPGHESSKLILASCHATMIRLGDLSRYLETELVPSTRIRKWDRAMHYYRFATLINPNSGISHNQLAVIALTDANHLHALYHLYRASLAKEPHPTAQDNLKIEFRKILNAWVKGEPLSATAKSSFVSLFIYLHAQCNKGVDFADHDELENDILGQVIIDLKERSLQKDMLEKCCLVNIAAERYAQTRSEATEEEDQHNSPPSSENASSTTSVSSKNANASLFYRRLNVKFFFVLLQVLAGELNEPERLTDVARSLLPSLRHYSSWLLMSSEQMMSDTPVDAPLHVQVNEFWKLYANILNLLTLTFNVDEMQDVPYLLEEDESTLGFTPLVSPLTDRRYHRDGRQKARAHEIQERYDLDNELLYRVKDFVVDGLDLVVSEKIPIVLTGENEAKKTFSYKEGLPPLSASREHFEDQPSSLSFADASVEREDIQGITDSQRCPIEDSTTASQSASVSYSLAMNRMVDNLVDNDVTEMSSGGHNMTQQRAISQLQPQRNHQPSPQVRYDFVRPMYLPAGYEHGRQKRQAPAYHNPFTATSGTWPVTTVDTNRSFEGKFGTNSGTHLNPLHQNPAVPTQHPTPVIPSPDNKPTILSPFPFSSYNTPWAPGPGDGIMTPPPSSIHQTQPATSRPQPPTAGAISNSYPQSGLDDQLHQPLPNNSHYNTFGSPSSSLLNNNIFANNSDANIMYQQPDHPQYPQYPPQYSHYPPYPDTAMMGTDAFAHSQGQPPPMKSNHNHVLHTMPF